MVLSDACELMSPLDLDVVQVYRARVKFTLPIIHLPTLKAAQDACEAVLGAECGCQAQVRRRLVAMPYEPDVVRVEPFVAEYLFECWGNRAHVYPLVELVMSTLVHRR